MSQTMASLFGEAAVQELREAVRGEVVTPRAVNDYDPTNVFRWNQNVKPQSLGF